jgi:membrane fusion protein (multidrug efflux system)
MGGHHKRTVVLIVGLAVAVAACVAGVLYYRYRSRYESTDDATIDGHPIVISARVSGNLIAVHVTDNQVVAAGELLAEIDPCDYQAQWARAEAAVAGAEADHEQAVAQAEVAEAELANQQQDLRRYEESVKRGAVIQQTLDHAQASARVAAASLNAATKRVAAARAQIRQSRAAADQALLKLSYAKVVAPAAGRVTRKSMEPGAYVEVGQPLLALVTDQMWVVANFREIQLTSMRPGQPAEVRVDAYPHRVFKAHVDSIQAGTGAAFSLFPPENATGNYVKIVQRIPVKIVLDEPPDPNTPLALGMSVVPRVRVRQSTGSPR